MARHRIALAAGVASLAIILAGCTPGTAEPEPTGGTEPSAPSGEVITSMGGGTYADLAKRFIDAEATAQNSALRPVQAIGDEPPRVTQVLTEQGQPGTIDVIQVSAESAARLAAAGALAPLDVSRLSNGPNIVEGLENEYCVAHIRSTYVIVYNADAVPSPPQSWKEFFDQPSLSTVGQVATRPREIYVAAATAVKGGDPGNDLMAGADLVAERGKEIQLVSSTDNIGQGLIAGDFDMTISPMARAASWAEQSGMNIKSLVPEEGAFEIIFYLCIPANAPNPDGAYAWIDAALSPSAQLGYAENMGYAPTITNANLPADLAERIALTADEQKRVFVVDETYAATIAEQLREHWQQNVVQG